MGKVKVDSTTSKSRGDRARSLRKALRYSRRALTEKYQFKSSTLQNWEDGRYGGLTEQGAVLLTKIYQSEGLSCTIEWLLFNIGSDPLESEELEQLTVPTPSSSQLIDCKESSQINSESDAINKELKLLREHEADLIDISVCDDAMSPMFKRGDRVAGSRVFSGSYDKIMGHPVIIEFIVGAPLLRIIKSCDKKGTVTLLTMNGVTSNKSKKHVYPAHEILSVAPILWLRRKTVV